MSGKRTATTDLNFDNWDQVEKSEEKGIFKTASDNELKNRVIKKARRKLAESDNSDLNVPAEKKSVFSGFAGFGKNASSNESLSTTLSSPFSFLSKISSSSSNSLNTCSEKKNEDKPVPVVLKTTDNVKSNTVDSMFSDQYCSKVKNLNQSVSAWIKKHIDENPICILTPIFKDYEKYLQDIKAAEDKKDTTKKDDNKFPAPTTTTSFNSFGGSISTNLFTTSSTGLNFGSPTNKTDSTPSGFSFSGSKPFTFGNVATNSAESSKPSQSIGVTGATAGDDEDYQPPEAEFKPVVEEDSVYDKRCKVFVKSDSNYADRGVGTLYLKPVKDSEKYQLIVRADTNLGNLLINIILSDAIPVQKMGKNNVMLVCIPTPEGEPKKPTPTLLRVKTETEADKLLEMINKYKK